MSIGIRRQRRQDAQDDERQRHDRDGIRIAERCANQSIHGMKPFVSRREPARDATVRKVERRGGRLGRWRRWVRSDRGRLQSANTESGCGSSPGSRHRAGDAPAKAIGWGRWREVRSLGEVGSLLAATGAGGRTSGVGRGRVTRQPGPGAVCGPSGTRTRKGDRTWAGLEVGYLPAGCNAKPERRGEHRQVAERCHRANQGHRLIRACGLMRLENQVCENICRPSGTRVFFKQLNPGLKSWAIGLCPCGAASGIVRTNIATRACQSAHTLSPHTVSSSSSSNCLL